MVVTSLSESTPRKYSISKITYRVFNVREETDEDYEDYVVRWTYFGWRCTCSRKRCKHINMVIDWCKHGMITNEW